MNIYMHYPNVGQTNSHNTNRKTIVKA